MISKRKISIPAFILSAIIMILVVGCSGQKSNSTPGTTSNENDAPKTDSLFPGIQTLNIQLQ